MKPFVKFLLYDYNAELITHDWCIWKKSRVQKTLLDFLLWVMKPSKIAIICEVICNSLLTKLSVSSWYDWLWGSFLSMGNCGHEILLLPCVLARFVFSLNFARSFWLFFYIKSIFALAISLYHQSVLILLWTNKFSCLVLTSYQIACLVQ